MGIISIVDLSSESGWTLDGGRTYSAELQVETDGPNVGARAVLDALNLFADTSYRWPLAIASTESDARCLLSSVKVSSTSADRKQWKAVLEFQPRSWEGDDKGPVDENGNRDPFAAPPALRARAEEEEVAVTIDAEGTPILNSAGDPFDPPMSVMVPSVVFEVSRLERTFDPALIADLQGRVNASTWLGFAAGSSLCKSIAASREWRDDVGEAGGWAWSVDYTMAYREPVEGDDGVVLPGWAAVVLDAGYRQKVGSDRKQILVDNAPASSPVPLKTDGTAALPTDAPNYLTFKVYPEADFAALDFPADLFTAGTPEV